MKLLFDFLPILLFFVAYKLADIYVATGVLIGVTLAQVGWIWLRQRRVEKLPLFTAGLVLVLGSLTLILHDPVFVKWKPTVVNWLFALAFIGSRFIGRQTLLERMLGGQMELPARIWINLTFMWAIFFLRHGRGQSICGVHVRRKHLGQFQTVRDVGPDSGVRVGAGGLHEPSSQNRRCPVKGVLIHAIRYHRP